MPKRQFKDDARYVTVKIDAKLSRRIDRFADAEFCKRAEAMRLLLERGLATTVMGRAEAFKFMDRALADALRGGDQ